LSNVNGIYISIVLSDGKFYVTTDKKGIISGFKTSQEGVTAYENLYMEWHKKDYEASMSACLNHMAFRPSIVKVSGVEEIRKIVGDEPHLFDISHVSGFLTGIQIPDPVVGQEYWDKGAKPQLIK
jgi:hypothetical protein